MTATLLGGLGLFLLGMLMLTDGLKALAGEALRSILTRFVSGPLSGVGWGTLVTALVQSSTATTLATVGFVSAGLLTFTQAVGVIFGANLGTTSTGWIVSQLGFKVSLGAISPPLVLLGVGMRLLGRGRVAHAGMAMAGFALLFIGIDMLQDGMGAMSSRLSPDDLPGAAAGGLLGRAILVAIGCLMTVVVQSSSAAMATTLAAVASGAIGLEQAAALIVGQNIGTTPTAMIAGLGAPAAAKRTALAHVLFNVLTAAVAFGALPALLSVAGRGAAAVGAEDDATTLAAFHTLFNVLGVAMLLPMVGPFSRLIERVVPERAPKPTRFLATIAGAVGPVGMEVARRAVAQVTATAARAAQAVARRRGVDDPEELRDAAAAIVEVRRFIHRMARAELAPADITRHNAILHATDHAERLLEALMQRTESGRLALRDPVAQQVAASVADLLADLGAACARVAEGAAGDGPPLAEVAGAAAAMAQAIAEQRRRERRRALGAVAAGDLDPEAADARIDTLLWLDRVAYHAWRAAHYLQEPPPGDAEGAEDAADRPPPHEGSGRSRGADATA